MNYYNDFLMTVAKKLSIVTTEEEVQDVIHSSTEQFIHDNSWIDFDENTQLLFEFILLDYIIHVNMIYPKLPTIKSALNSLAPLIKFIQCANNDDLLKTVLSIGNPESPKFEDLLMNIEPSILKLKYETATWLKKYEHIGISNSNSVDTSVIIQKQNDMERFINDCGFYGIHHDLDLSTFYSLNEYMYESNKDDIQYDNIFESIKNSKKYKDLIDLEEYEDENGRALYIRIPYSKKYIAVIKYVKYSNENIEYIHMHLRPTYKYLDEKGI